MKYRRVLKDHGLIVTSTSVLGVLGDIRRYTDVVTSLTALPQKEICLASKPLTKTLCTITNLTITTMSPLVQTFPTVGKVEKFSKAPNM